MQIPRGKLTVISGLSGSGKSSLAFDTIFAEGQRRYVESLSAYARQFLDQMQKPDVDEISGLSPAISIDQKSRSNNPRSTVATITEIYDYLRVLMARVGRPHCLVCGDQITKLSVDEIVDFIVDKVEFLILDLEAAKVDLETVRLDIFSPIVRVRKGEHYQMLYDLLSKGYSYARVDGETKSLREKIELSPRKKHTIELLVDQFQISEFAEEDPKFKDEVRSRLTEAVEKSLLESDMLVVGSFDIPTKTKKDMPEDFLLSSRFACPKDGFSFGEIEPRTFSFNSPVGACSDCNGLGTESLFSKKPCLVCDGRRLKNEALAVFIGKGESQTTSIFDIKGFKTNKKEIGLNIVDITALTISDALDFFKTLKLSRREKEIAKPILREISERITFMNDVGIDYISLDRRANTLSGGEAQRIRLASQLGSGLVGATYVLDEPTIGLHQRDNDRLIQTLLKMRDMGNTVIVVEHDEDVIYAADYLIDIGPLAGNQGGEVTAMGFLHPMLSASTNPTKSKTLGYLRNEEMIPLPEKRRESKKGEIKITGAHIHNINNLNITFPLGKFICITGVSGSGKSSFMHDVLYRNIDFYQKNRKKIAKGGKMEFTNCADISNMDSFSRTVLINQSPIGRTPRSNPATYTGAFTFIRELYAATTEAKVRAYKPGRFSFNVPGGRCEHCSGNGQIKVEMHFLPDVYVQCDICHGKRFAKETLEVTYKNKNISQVLEMGIKNASVFFKDIPQISDRLKALENVGLGYLRLGQSATTLSGGEAQRVKIASELYRPHTEKTLYLLDEPTVGLHYDDVAKLNDVLQLLVDKGNTVMVIEHNLDLIKVSDYIIDFGPDGGERGGKIVAKGNPEKVAESEKSLTGKYLKKTLSKKLKK